MPLSLLPLHQLPSVPAPLLEFNPSGHELGGTELLLPQQLPIEINAAALLKHR